MTISNPFSWKKEFEWDFYHKFPKKIFKFRPKYSDSIKVYILFSDKYLYLKIFQNAFKANLQTYIFQMYHKIKKNLKIYHTFK